MNKRVVMTVTNDVVSDPRVEKEATALSGAGWDVTILAWDRQGSADPIVERDGFRIERLGPRARSGGGLSSLSRFRGFWDNATARAIELDPAVVHCHDLDTAVVGMRVKHALPSASFVLDHHELYRSTRMVPQRGLKGVVARAVVDALDHRAARRADLIVIANPGHAPRYERLAPGKTITVENAPELERFHPVAHHDEGPFTVCYIGQKRYAESLLQLIDMVSRHDDLAALLAGGGVAEAQIEAAASGVPRVRTLGRVLYSQIPELYEGCDAVFVVYDANLDNVRYGLQVKIIEGMACGLPVIVNAGTYAGDLVERERIGVTVDGADPVAVEAAVLGLKNDRAAAREMGARGRALVEGGLNWQASVARLVTGYARLAE